MCALIWEQGKKSNVCFLDFESDHLLPTKFLYRTEECALCCPSLDLTEFILFIFNWRIIALQCCISFWCTAISLHISPSFWSLPPPPTHPTPLGCHRALGWAESFCYTSTYHWISVLHMVMHMFPRDSLNSSHPLLPLLHLQVYSLCLCLSLFLPCKKFH